VFYPNNTQSNSLLEEIERRLPVDEGEWEAVKGAHNMRMMQAGVSGQRNVSALKKRFTVLVTMRRSDVSAETSWGKQWLALRERAVAVNAKVRNKEGVRTAGEVLPGYGEDDDEGEDEGLEFGEEEVAELELFEDEGGSPLPRGGGEQSQQSM
jgi:hypothetical protein